MQDFVPNGTGNSRYLKSVENFKMLYPTYDNFVAALVDGTLPVDFNGINMSGIAQIGTALNKASLLKDTTAALFGLGGDAVPDDVLNAIKTLINGANANADAKAQIATGSYKGTGTFGSSKKNTLTFDFVPLFVVVTQQSTYGPNTILLVNGQTRTSHLTASSSSYGLTVSWNDNVVKWYANSSDGTASSQLNINGTTYYYAAIG